MTTARVQTALVQEPALARAADGSALRLVSAAGARVTDSAGCEWIDLDNAKGSVLLGHADERVAEAVERAARGGAGAASGWSELLDTVPEQLLAACGGDGVALFRTGTSAVRALACSIREARGRSLLLSAGFHGYDPMWKPAPEPFEPNAAAVVDFHFDLDALRRCLARHQDVAAILISPDHIYLTREWFDELQALADAVSVPIVLDEVKLGFRYRNGLSVPGDVLLPAAWAVSKGIANGHPLAAVGGDRELIEPLRTFTYTSMFEPTALAAAHVTLGLLEDGSVQRSIRASGDRFVDAARRAIAAAGLPVEIAGDGTMFQFVPAGEEVEEALYTAAARAGLILFRGDNQAPSAAFADVADDACERMRSACGSLAGDWPHSLDEAHRYAAAWDVLDGLPPWPRSGDATRRWLTRLMEAG